MATRSHSGRYTPVPLQLESGVPNYPKSPRPIENIGWIHRRDALADIFFLVKFARDGTLPIIYYGDDDVLMLCQNLFPDRTFLSSREYADRGAGQAALMAIIRQPTCLIIHGIKDDKTVLRLHNLIKPRFALLPFNPPIFRAADHVWLQGEIYLFPWDTPTSYESHMIIQRGGAGSVGGASVLTGYDPVPMVTYNITAYQQHLRYHNYVTRRTRVDKTLSPPELTDDNDSAVEVDILNGYVAAHDPRMTYHQLVTILTNSLLGRSLAARREELGHPIHSRGYSVDELNSINNVLNPPCEIAEYVLDDSISGNITIYVIDDSMLPGGTKQRALGQWMINSDRHEFVYGSVELGFGQIAVAYSAKIVGKRATIFVGQMNQRDNPLTALARTFGAQIHATNIGRSSYEPAASRYVDKDPDYRELLPFGFEDESFIQLAVEQITLALPVSLKRQPPRRLWIVAGSGTLLQAMYRIFPQTHILTVTVGQEPDLTRNEFVSELHRTTWFHHNRKQKFPQPVDASLAPPYSSLLNYDAKVWQYVMEHGDDGDYVWNVGGQP